MKSVTQTIFLSIIGLVLAFYLVRFLRTRSVKQYSPSELAARLSSPGAVMLLDVRTEGERKSQFIKGSAHIPLHELRKRLEELARHREREIVCYCQSGSRSLSAALILIDQGYKAASLRGGIVDWNFHQR